MGFEKMCAKFVVMHLVFLLAAVSFFFADTNMKAIAFGSEGEVHSNYQGKKANFIGDSITQGNSSYVATVRDLLGLEVVRNYGISGGALCYRKTIERFAERKFNGKLVDDAYPPAVERWNQMDNDADIIFMLIGTNDFNSRVPLGEADSLDPNEFNGGLNLVLAGLKEKYPDKLIIVSTILRRKGGGRLLTTYNQAIIDASKRHGIVLFDAYETAGIDLDDDYTSGKKVQSRDGLHPNPEAASILGRNISVFISQQVPQPAGK